MAGKRTWGIKKNKEEGGHADTTVHTWALARLGNRRAIPAIQSLSTVARRVDHAQKKGQLYAWPYNQLNG